jgi:hypothetical protein
VSAIEAREPKLLELKETVNPFIIFGREYGPFRVNTSCPKTTVMVEGPAKIVPGKPLPLLFQPASGHRWTARCE